MIPEDTPSVIKQGSHFAICLGLKRKFWWLIPMSNKMLRVVKRTGKQFESDRWSQTDHDVQRVAKIYLQHGAGVGPVAEKFLHTLIKTPTQLEIDFDCDLIGELP